MHSVVHVILFGSILCHALPAKPNAALIGRDNETADLSQPNYKCVTQGGPKFWWGGYQTFCPGAVDGVSDDTRQCCIDQGSDTFPCVMASTGQCGGGSNMTQGGASALPSEDPELVCFPEDRS